MADERTYAQHFQAYQKALAAGNQAAADYIKGQMDAAFNRMPVRPDNTLHLSKGGRFADSQGNPVGYNSETGRPMEEPSSVHDVNNRVNSEVERAKELAAGMPEWERQMVAGGGAALRSTGGLARLATGGTLVTPEELKEEDKVLAPFEKGRGAAELAGQVLAPMPGKGVGTLAGRVLPAALAKIAGNTVAGAIQGAAQGDPDKPGMSAALGAAGSGVSQLLNRGGDAALRGVVQHVPGAQGLIDAAKDVGQKMFIPITENSALMRSWFPRAIASLTQGRGETTRSLNAAKDVARNVISAQSVPKNVPFPVGSNPLEHAADVTQKYNEFLRNTIGSHALNVDATGSERPLEDRLHGYMTNLGIPEQSALNLSSNMAGEIMRNTEAGGAHILGGNYHFALQNIDKMLKGAVDSGGITSDHAANAMKAARSILQENIAENRGIPGGEQFVRELSNYAPASARWSNEIEPWVQAAQKAGPEKGGRYNFGDLAASTPLDSQVTRDTAETAAQVLKKPEQTPGNLAEVVDRTISHPIKSVFGLTLGNIGANPGIQKALYGDTGMQKAMQSVLKQYPELGNLFSGLSQRGAVAGAEDATGQ